MKAPLCERCGWRYGGFHICVDLSTPEPKLLEKVDGRVGPMSETQKRNISNAQQARLVVLAAKNRPRNEKIILRYRDQKIGTKQLSEEFELSRTSIVKILRQAEGEGRLTIRRRGVNIRFEGEYEGDS